MLSGRQQNRPQVHDVIPVQIKPRDRRLAARGLAEESQAVIAPPEVIAPGMAAGVVERDPASRLRVDRLCRRELAAVAALTGPGQIIQGIGSPATLRDDVFGGKIIRGVIRRTAAVFTPSVGPLLNKTPGLAVDHGGYSTGVGRSPSSWISASKDVCRISASLMRYCNRSTRHASIWSDIPINSCCSLRVNVSARRLAMRRR